CSIGAGRRACGSRRERRRRRDGARAGYRARGRPHPRGRGAGLRSTRPVNGRSPQVVAMGGGGFGMEPDNPLLDDFVLGLTGVDRPRVCFLPTATGNVATYIVNFYEAFSRRAEASHLDLFVRTRLDLRTFILDQDVVYVGGGNTANLLAIWRVHGLDAILREAWEAGVVMAGISAG